MNHSFSAIDDPIEEALPLAIDAAARFCRGRHDPNNICFIYHRLWPRLQRIGSSRSIWLHSGKYVDAFRQFANAGLNRLLVSGSADYALIAHVLVAFRAEGIEPEITVLDVCEAPLRINRWYAERHNSQIKTIAQDLFEFEDEEGFDIITTDNFFTHFQPEDRSKIARKWRQLLRPSGKVVTAQNISTEPSSKSRSLSEDDINRRLEGILENARKHTAALDITPEELVQDAASYYTRRNYSKINSVRELCMLFETNGFEVETVASLGRRENGDRRTSSHFKPLKPVHFVATKISRASASPSPTFPC